MTSCDHVLMNRFPHHAHIFCIAQPAAGLPWWCSAELVTAKLLQAPPSELRTSCKGRSALYISTSECLKPDECLVVPAETTFHAAVRADGEQALEEARASLLSAEARAYWGECLNFARLSGIGS